MTLDPDAIQDCKNCGGTGRVSVGNVCTGFGGKLTYIECMCVTYKAIGMDPETGEKTK